MKFILDGYNVIGKADHINLSDSDKEYKLIQWLSNYLKKGMQLTIVYDGQNEHMNFPTKEKYQGITMIRTSGDRSADDYIKQKLITQSNPENTVIVTSDRDIIQHAKQAKFNVMTSDEFLKWFCKTEKPKQGKKSPRITDKHVDYWLNKFEGNTEEDQ